MSPLILTLNLDSASFRFFDDLRQKHFPPERNFLAAHVTLFHHLPGAEIETVKQDLAEICRKFVPFSLKFTRWRFLGKGSAMTIESADLLKLRANLADRWFDWLTPQDRQKFQPHITVQNKTEPPEAKILFENLSADWQEKSGVGEGLSLWHYENPRWRLEESFSFQPVNEI